MVRSSLLALLSLLFVGCTAITIDPVANVQDIDAVCIVENPKVIVADFVPVLERRFKEHGIETKFVSSKEGCKYTLDYTAERSWDLKAYLDYANLTLRKDGVMIGNAEYRNRGGLTLTKYAGTASKMNPVIDELLGKTP